ncbi:hypothetical protein A2313_04490 [Candidatus Roizmanbacteria bacterium RIFOXYB2_FULL_41_10]|uniref:Glycosyltransferase 2-like domain-containing protein n=1 Tax=Candidatus Roizmanbacteria bacterium RIFOXYA1_FULL_41_12 TaxID=1802082 RepID=A0A1F7K262_9BACT|nr:MAG: hypothetical protein A2209_04995 [Candidatus Roizmanbacteria bacterium RIFOXYA1_FULL_41_12]OGK66238.1 MAG: hypothetical protein A2262_02315 [Candidatus Roizmanbacteria bacterium RIFOXYA2_FULL_41_8]OGK66913.1 MAG: hypothetical protein A2377_03375 [Candidatus Roizmanbacteria bacterium RIFOXYB1_FULL_41_27]OGK70714.1 MAG: hypothetical protein A2403_01330 [Candidatus Roizmanbacteria bacterium RIFOXYC1_FULL_41_16]OGK71586.1 MAG: hypothetical protein A2313_04490 [Candidatus Roizmanbacteria bac
MTSLPSLSIIVPTLNAAAVLPKFLRELKSQEYPANKLELIVVDGGSSDSTREVAAKFGARVIDNPDRFAEPGVRRGIKAAKGSIITVLATDNFFKNRRAVSELVTIINQPNVAAVFSKQVSDGSDSIYTKYINTFTDPFSHYLYGSAANSRTFSNKYPVVINTKNYVVFNFKNSKQLPLLALAQGMTIWKKLLVNKHDLDDVAPLQDLIKKNKQIAYAKHVHLLHHTVRDLKHFWQKQCWSAKNAFENKQFGIASRQDFITQEQKIKSLLFPLYSLLILPALTWSIYKAIVDREPLWLLHSWLCFLTTMAIIYTLLMLKAIELTKQLSLSKISHK